MTGLQLVLAGAAVGNGNRGIEALARSVADGIDRDAPGSSLSILDDGWGIRHDSSRRYRQTSVDYVGVRRSRRWHRPESWAQVRVAQSLYPRANRVARRFGTTDAVLDLSGGDSFTDMYGDRRLKSVIAPKYAALRAKRRLVLLPQTYGPFKDPDSRQLAARLIRSSTLAYARDPRSYERLLEIAGPDADASRLRSGVDIAFGLVGRQPVESVVAPLETIVDEPIVGVNISGLLRTQADYAHYKLAGDYLETMTLLVRQLVQDGARVVFVSHVHGPDGAGESDSRSINAIVDRLTVAERDRTLRLPPTLDAAETKWCISRLDWFVGSRMHATIAALSTCTPAVGYAYSDKTQGVFETCGVGDQVIDARLSTGLPAVDRMMQAYRDRRRTGELLSKRVPTVVESSRRQLREVLTLLRSSTESTTSCERSELEAR